MGYIAVILGCILLLDWLYCSVLLLGYIAVILGCILLLTRSSEEGELLSTALMRSSVLNFTC